MGKEIKIWFDKEGDYLEVIFEKKEGYFKETERLVLDSGSSMLEDRHE